MSKGHNTTATTSSASTAPDPVAYQNYLALTNRATQVSNKPYEAYTGEETAPINAQQQAGFGNINAGAAGFNPAEAWSDIGQGSMAVDANDINQYMDPYTNEVIGATQADFDTQNERANSIVTGNAAAASALGGNRVGVAQALTQEGQNRVQAPQLAGLRSAGFQNAVTNANAQKARQLQGGQTAEQLGMSAASAQVGAGSMEQTTQQTADTQRMADYYRAQGYDFQTAQWLASILLPTGSQMGSSSTGQSTTQGPTPNQWAQGAGLGIAAAGMFIKDGGRIPGFAAGGAPWSDGGSSWIPDVKVTGQALPTPGFPKHANMSEQKTDTSKMGAGLGKIGAGLYDKFGRSQGDNNLSTDLPGNGSGIYTGDASMPGFSGGSDSIGEGGYWARGGGVGRRGYAEGGVPISTGFGGGAFGDDDLSPNDAVSERFANPMLGSDQYKNMGEHSRALTAEGMQRQGGEAATADNAPLMPRPVKTSSFQKPPGVAQGDIVPRAMQAFKSIKSGVEPPKALSFADDEGVSDATDFSARRRRSAVEDAPPGVAAERGKNIFGLPKISDEARQGLISMGLGMMATRRGGPGSFLGAMGEGGEQGMTTYASAKSATAAAEALKRKEAFEREKFERPYQELTAQQKAAAGLNPWRIGKDGVLEATPGGPHDPKTIRAEAEAKLPPGLEMSAASLAAAAEVYRMTGKLPPNMGRGVQGDLKATSIRNHATEKELNAGGDPSEWSNRWQVFGTRAAGLRSFEQRAAGLTLAENEARALLPRVREASAKVDRTRFPDLNSLILAAQQKTGGEDVIKLGIAIQSLIPVYARVLKPVGQIGQQDMANSQHLLEKSWSDGQINAALDQFEIELHSAKTALAQARKEYSAAGQPDSKAEATPTTPAPPKTVARSGKVTSGPNAGKTVVEFSDGTKEYK